MSNTPNAVVFTNKARCRDCYRCLRVCPVKAIRLENGQASVVPELCIACGTCVRECPQRAKQYRHDVDTVVKLIASGRRVAASVAPSFVAELADWERLRLPAVLRSLGFAYVAETAVGAWQTAKRTAELAAGRGDKPSLCTACPALVKYVTAYRPQLADMLLPVASPMVVHARMIKEHDPEMAVVFIGPCVAKKAEAAADPNVDIALTFEELFTWLERENVDFKRFEESAFDEVAPEDSALFPLPGGLLETASAKTPLLSNRTVSISGFDEIREALDSLESKPDAMLVEALFCPQGCINGPGLARRLPLFERRRAVMEHARERAARVAEVALQEEVTGEEFPAAPAPLPAIGEDDIRRVLEETGKARPEDQLNCGACGYPSCRAKAEAVLRGMAEREMCLPLMRRLAERRTDRIIETSPNGILIVDEHLAITHMNPAFRQFFMCSDAILGRKVSYLMDPEPFERLAVGNTDIIKATNRHDAYNLTCHEIYYALRDEKQYVGIFMDITHTQMSQKKLDELRERTVAQAKELLDHQIKMAQQMARFLGESSAQGEALVQNLLKLADDSDAEEAKKPWDTSTST